MFKWIAVLSLMLRVGLMHASTVTLIEENSNVDVNLSVSNINRLVVQGDKITRAHVSEGLLHLKHESDGSLYARLQGETPFTLFLTTAKGRHFSATIRQDAGLGQTIEFVPKVIEVSSKKSQVRQSNTLPSRAYTEPLRVLIKNMMQLKKPDGFWVKPQYGQVIQLREHLKLVPKRLYQGRTLTGEVIKLYNSGMLPIDLHEAWFMAHGVKAISLSTKTLFPKKKAWVYRVSEHA
jgi:conjugal transfer pilus assembly protein TraK